MGLFEELEKEMAEANKEVKPTQTNQQAAVSAIQLFIVFACLCGIVVVVAGTVRLLLWWF